MSIGSVVIVFVIVSAIVVATCAIAIFLQRNFPSEKFDERQKIARGNAYCFSHWVGMAYYFGLMVYLVFHTGKSEWVLEPFLLIVIGILIQLDSFHIYCLMTHSALPLGEKPLHTIIGYFILSGMYLVQYFVQYIPEDAAEAAGLAGAESYNLLRLLFALSFFSLAICHLIACLRKEKE